MPDDYYVSQYSGEEIDALLGGAGAGTVRYDAAQSLTDAQKQQARGNIAAAPDGLGLGANGYPYAYTTVTGDTVNSLSRSGLYWFSDAEKPLYTDGNNSGTSGLLLHLQGSFINTLSARQIFFPNYPVNGVGHNCRIEREKTTDEGWLPWEFVNPPLVLGVEYRTTERFLGKPVYVKAINFGAVAIGLNQVSFMSDVDRPIRCYAMLTNTNATIPWIGTPGTDQSFCSINGANARIHSTAAFSAGAVVFVGYYYKTNE